MVVGVLQARLAIYEAMSLKDKRRIIKSLKDRLRQKFNISVAETDQQDVWQSAVISAALVSNDGTFAERCLQEVVEQIRHHRGATLVDYQIEMV